MKQQPFYFTVFLCLLFSVVRAQTPAQKGSQQVEIIKSDLLYLQPEISRQILSGNVKLKQGTTLFYCDSCIVNSKENTFEAFGNVHINDNDTTNVWSNYLYYVGNKKMAYLKGNVKLSDGHATLTTPELEYDVSTKTGTYKNGGRVVNKKSVLTSREGTYYTDLRDIYFKTNVELKDPAYNLKSDSLLYNTETQVAGFIAETLIKDSSGRIIKTSQGYYDVANSRAEFTSRTTMVDKALTVTGDRIASDDSAQIVQIEGRAVLVDTAQGVNILADRIFVDKKTSAYLATKKPLMIIKQDKDSIYVAADTLFSAKLTDLYKNSDSLLKQLGLRDKDSTNRYFEAYRNVRIFSDSLQAVSDSLFYSFKDSAFNLFYDPVVWSRKSQITGDTIYLFTKNKKADRINVFDNSFMVSEVEPGVYNQIKARRMNGSFVDGKVDSLHAIGTAESVYFLQDDDSAYTSVNQTASEMIDAYFEKGELYKVVFIKDLKATLSPISQKGPVEMRLPAMRWLEERRPKTKYELFE
jgi:lipopolysaccharide export system protein LptA